MIDLTPLFIDYHQQQQYIFPQILQDITYPKPNQFFNNVWASIYFIFQISNNHILMQEESIDSIQKIQYTTYEQLPNPTSESISQGTISLGFASKEWHIQFQTITNLRQANRYYSNVFINELLPNNYKQILGQVENIRSNNSKEALTLLSQFIEFHQLANIAGDIIRPFVSALIIKSNSEKGFIKAQALKGLSSLTLKWSQPALEELCIHTQSINGQISELSIKLIGEMLQNKKDAEVNDKFLKSLSLNLNGKRAFVQKKAREILNLLKNRVGSQKLQQKINISTQLLQQQSNTLKKQLKFKEEQKSKGSLKDFLKAKKQST